MRLNEQEKNVLRKNIEETIKRRIEQTDLKELESEKIYLDKELLEQLLFNTMTIELDSSYGFYYGKKVQAKTISWRGLYLKYIDLSEVSFDDVIWENNNLSETNAYIDFRKSFSVKWRKPLVLHNCSFRGVDLSNNVIDYNCCIDDCNLSNTGLKLDLNSKCIMTIKNSDLRGLDLSKYVVNEMFFWNSVDNNKSAIDCVLIDTGLKVNIKSDNDGELKVLSALYQNLEHSEEDVRTSLLWQMEEDEEVDQELVKALASSEGQDYVKKYLYKTIRNQLGYYADIIPLRKYLGSMIKEGNLTGCYVNDKKILSDEEKKVIYDKNLSDYIAFKNKVEKRTIKDVDSQLQELKLMKEN